MRWYKKRKADIRYRRRFALFPCRIGNEVRWLEMIYLKQSRWYDWDEKGWENIKFLTKEDYLLAIGKKPKIIIPKTRETTFSGTLISINSTIASPQELQEAAQPGKLPECWYCDYFNSDKKQCRIKSPAVQIDDKLHCNSIKSTGANQ